jgi:hypothetical protein
MSFTGPVREEHQLGSSWMAVELKSNIARLLECPVIRSIGLEAKNLLSFERATCLLYPSRSMLDAH